MAATIVFFMGRRPFAFLTSHKSFGARFGSLGQAKAAACRWYNHIALKAEREQASTALDRQYRDMMHAIRLLQRRLTHVRSDASRNAAMDAAEQQRPDRKAASRHLASVVGRIGQAATRRSQASSPLRI